MSTPATLKQSRKLLSIFGDDPSSQQVQNLLGNGDLVQLMLEADLSKVDRKAFQTLLTPPLPDIFTSLETQLTNVRRWNAERNWGFTDADFDAIDVTSVEHAGLDVDVIAVYLPDEGKTSGMQRTFEELWDIATSVVQLGKLRDDSLKSDPKHLRLLDGIEHTPGIRRVTLDLGANRDTKRGIRLKDVRGPDSVHAEILAAAAHFPNWVQAMDGEQVPYVWMPGYQVSILDFYSWREVPYLYGSDRTVELGTDWDDSRLRYWACPVVMRRES